MLSTKARLEMIDLSRKLEGALADRGATAGLVHLYCPHTTAGLTINEGADPAVRRDILAALAAMVPDLAYTHQEGNSPAHVMASLVGSSVQIPFREGRLGLGTWQRIFFCEFDGPRTRHIQWLLV